MRSALIDVQNDYFPGGKLELEGSQEAGLQATSVVTLAGLSAKVQGADPSTAEIAVLP
jgi:hypothetical protein